ncbi:Protein phosphatase 2C 2 [Imshaugia aleurites]|uniref:Protein phosphatase 2C homolog 2 n=1 Tax=Imshaugia aleurites TaxID=172621 RepID=A0A8H3EVT3_9LECA|nr:Protein phosphatase 2C 2 [Imshaugia aleurites]
MGQTLSEPVVEKISDDGQDDRVAFGVSAMQGWRISMEDAHAAVLDLQVEDAEKGFVAAGPEDRLSFFGVYDGHGGDKVALFAGDNIHKILAKQEAFKNKDFEQALKDGFLATDRAILSDPKYEEEVSGCTASVGLISKTTIYVVSSIFRSLQEELSVNKSQGNAGDSRSVLGVKGRAKPLSYDHKPQNEGEKARICAAGGFVDFGRVNGNLALSRAIGDFEFKKSAELSPEQQIVTAFPDVIAHTITDDDEFLVIACDGIWDCQSSQAVVEFVRRGIAAKQELSKISENMMDNCLASNSETGGVGCDNMTMIVIALLRGKSKDEWYKEIGDRVAKGDGPCAPPEYAEFRGPGMRQNFEDSGDDYDLDVNQRNRGVGGRSGRIILLGDGTEVLTDSDETEMFDHEEEDKDLASQVNKGQTKLDDESRAGREETPGPESHGTSERQQTPESMEQNPFDTPSSTTSEKSDITETTKADIKVIPESALPEKLVTPATNQNKK